MGNKFFLYSNQANTSGNYWLFYDVEPYPLIALFGMSQEEDYTKVQDWIKTNLTDIKIKIADYRDRIPVPLDSWILMQKNEKKMNRSFDIYDDGIPRKDTALVVLEVDGAYRYIKVGGNYPKRKRGSNEFPDKELIEIEYLRRIEDGTIIRS